MAQDISCVQPFTLPKSIIISGQTGSGKTHLLIKMLLHADKVFDPVPDRIIFVYSIFQPIYEQLERSLADKIQFRKDIPTCQELIEYYEQTGCSTMLCLDDKISSLDDSKSGKNLVELTCIVSHHCKVTLLYLLQNLYHNSSSAREIALNSQVNILFRNDRSASQVRKFASQIMPGNINYFMDSYEQATATPHGYLVADLTPGLDKKFRLKTHVLAGQDLKIYLPNNAAH